MFDDPEHKSYIALCRELHLEHEFERGDWWTGKAGPVHLHEGRDYDGEPLRTSDGIIWLPRLDQWVGMLKEFHDVTFAGAIEVEDGHAVEGWEVEARGLPFVVFCPTPEEGAARLWACARRDDRAYRGLKPGHSTIQKLGCPASGEWAPGWKPKD